MDDIDCNAASLAPGSYSAKRTKPNKQKTKPKDAERVQTIEQKLNTTKKNGMEWNEKECIYRMHAIIELIVKTHAFRKECLSMGFYSFLKTSHIKVDQYLV